MPLQLMSLIIALAKGLMPWRLMVKKLMPWRLIVKKPMQWRLMVHKPHLYFSKVLCAVMVTCR